ncbi:MAG: hypothetical protein HQM16_10685 [Deltaproteobacteria bacterium]|nr:hypothetical protein [Deltaproteobacteria bacterium]
MKTQKYILNSVAIIVILSINACGLKVNSDIDEAAKSISDAVESINDGSSQNNQDEDAAETVSDVDATSDNDANVDKPSEAAGEPEDTTVSSPYTGSKEGDSHTGGGVTVIEPAGYPESAERFFMGTYELENNYTTGKKSCSSEYNFPLVVRGYAHTGDDFIDFETNVSNLAWVAEIFPDNTFDFSVQFLDTFGSPSIQLDCTCQIEEGYLYYYTDQVNCTCGGSDKCSLSYEKMTS